MVLVIERRQSVPELLKETADGIKALEIQTLKDQLRRKTKKVDEASENYHKEYREWLIMFNRLILLEGKHTHIGRL